jgi:uncharacterized repeat protein (TIGR01451 family)
MKKYLTLITAFLIFTPVFIQASSAEDITISGNTIWEAGIYTYNNVLITNGATLTFDGAVLLNVQNLTIDIGSSISADGKGYAINQGPGAGSCSGGGSYGGRGGRDSGSTYGSAIAPEDLGSGGGSCGYWTGKGGAGGGAIKLIVSDLLTINGKITANGKDTSYESQGAGSGGSVYIITNGLKGQGEITANGGNGFYGGGGGSYAGGGGRVAIYYATSTFTGKAEAKGGTGGGGWNGKDGTSGLFDTQNNIFYSGPSFKFQENDSPFNFNKVILNNSKVNTEGKVSLTANDLTIKNNSILTLSGNETFSINNVTINSNSTVTPLIQAKIYLNLQNLFIDSTSSISADGKGYPINQGPGSKFWAGASYGGKGGGNSAPTYGSAVVPEDLGSGAGGSFTWWAWKPGAGGGAIKLIIFDTLSIEGKVTCNGESVPYENHGAGSGGSVYIIAKNLSGQGEITANGGSGNYNGGLGSYGGGGGRIAIYYSASSFTGKTEAKGGTGYHSGQNGEDGTVVFQCPSLDTPFTFFNLSEKSFTTSTSLEILESQEITLNNVTVNGDLSGTLNFTDLEIVKINTGSFSGKGFSKGEFEANLEGLTYKGDWRGATYFIPSENKIYLKGEISGDISGIVEGFLVESTPGNGIYDKYQATWKLNRLNIENLSAIISLEGTLSYLPPSSFTSGLYLYQANMEGGALGYYAGPLNAVVTHLRLTSENAYKGQGFSIISYNSSLGQGEAWAYNYTSAPNPNIVEFQGLFKDPILGKLSGFLDENKSPKTLSGTIERLDFGAEPQAELKVNVWSPTRVSPGEKIYYIIEYRNDGLKAAENVFISCLLDTFVKYIYASAGVHYSPYAHRLTWKISSLPAKSMGYLSFQVEIIWGLPPHTFLQNYVYITNIGE